MKIKINKEFLNELLHEEVLDGFKIVKDEICDSSRWAIQYDCVIYQDSTGKYFDASYSVGATEYQDESPFDDYDIDENGCIELFEVEPFEVKKIEYRRKVDE